MEEQKEIEEMNQTQRTPWLVNNILFSYEGERHMGNNSERKQYFLQHKENHSNNKEAHTDGSKSTGRKVGFVAVHADITRGGALPEEASIQTSEMTAIKIALRKIKKENT